MDLPHWLTTRDNRYDQYGSRARSSAETPPTAYAKYGAPPAREIRARRPRKAKEARPSDEDILPYRHLKATNPALLYYQTFQSHIRREGNDVNQIIRSHYNQRTQQSKYQGNRTRSPIIKLRNFNNVIKYLLLALSSGDSPDKKVLDLCCGKGGDLNKMEFIKTSQYVGIDISDASIREAFSRYEKNKNHFPGNGNTRKFNFQAYLATGDVFSALVPEILEPNFPGIIEGLFPVDCVLVQFSLHYSFETEFKARCLVLNVARSLKRGGTFVGTVPLLDYIKQKILAASASESAGPDGPSAGREGPAGPNSSARASSHGPGAHGPGAHAEALSFGNEIYKVTFHKQPPADGDFNLLPFGNGYNYSLVDAIDDVPEYVVPFETLRKICEENDLVLRAKRSFVDFFNENIPRYFDQLNGHLVESIRRRDGKYGIEGVEREAIEFYCLFVFEKT